jgi:galactokinase
MLGPTLTKRLRFVVEENQRVLSAVLAIEQRDWAALGEYLQLSHIGLRDDYEVSCAELDFLTTAVAGFPEILGARMMGGGFGGCTINLSTIPLDAAFVEEISSRYRREFGTDCAFIDVNLAGGAQFELLSQ